MKLGVFLVFVAGSLTFFALRYEGVFLALLWPAAAALVVATAYLGLGPRVLGKRADGTLPALRVALLFPFFAFMWTLWHLQRRLGEPLCNEIVPGLYLGRRPLPGELPADVKVVVDLTSEFAEPGPVMQGRTYRAVPALDAGVPTDAAFEALVREVAAAKEPVYVHCASGHERSATVVAAVLIARGLASDAADAERRLKEKRPSVRLHGVQRRIVDRIAPRLREG